MSSNDPAVYDHVRPTGEGDRDSEAGAAGPVFRVVGVQNDEATLLRVTDADGTREATGEIRQVPLDRLLREFTPAKNPDAGWGWKEYFAVLLVGGGVAVAAHPAFDLLTGVLLILAGLYTLRRRGTLALPV
jgi:hypothetical protein